MVEIQRDLGSIKYTDVVVDSSGVNATLLSVDGRLQRQLNVR